MAAEQMAAQVETQRTLSSGSTIRLTCAVMVTVSGKMEKPLIVFRGKPGAHIEQECHEAGNGYADNGQLCLHCTGKGLDE